MELKSCYIESRIIHQKHPIYIEELLNLEYDPKKQRLEHLKGFGKDTADAAASVVHILTHKIASYKKTRRTVSTAKLSAHRQIVVNKI